MKITIKIIHPSYFLLYSFILCILCTLVPPSLYEGLIEEKNFMFFNYRLYLFLLISILFIWIGIQIGSKIKINRIRLFKRTNIKIYNLKKYRFYLIILTFSICILVLSYLLRVIVQNPDIIFFFIFGRGDIIKNQVRWHLMENSMYGAIPLAVGYCWWLFSESLQSYNTYLKRNLLFNLIVVIFILLFCLTLTISRFMLLPLFFGLALIFFRKLITSRKSVMTFLPLILCFFLFSLAGFILFSFLRASYDDFTYLLLRDIIGYGSAGMNRMAAILDNHFDDIVHRFTPTLYKNQFQFLFSMPFMNRLVQDSNDISINSQLDTFDMIHEAGLNSNYNWLTLFGGLWLSFGIFSFIYLIFLGMFFAFSWQLFITNSILGVLTYPWFCFCILFCCCTNFIASRDLNILILSSILYMTFFNLWKVIFGQNYLNSSKKV